MCRAVICLFKGGEACSCKDCEAACPVQNFDVPDEHFFLFGGFDGMAFIMIMVFSIGTVIFLSTVFVSHAFGSKLLCKCNFSDRNSWGLTLDPFSFLSE